MRNPLTSLSLAVIKIYQICISPFLGTNCRYHPSCSGYTREALRRHGLPKGFALGFFQILR